MKDLRIAYLAMLLVAWPVFAAWVDLKLPKPPAKRKLIFGKLKELAASVIGNDSAFQGEKKEIDAQLAKMSSKIFDARREDTNKKRDLKNKLETIKSKMSELSSRVLNTIEDLNTIIKFKDEQEQIDKESSSLSLVI